MTNNISTYGTVLRSLTRDRNGATTGRNARERFAVHAGEQGWICLTREDANLAILLGAVIVAVEEDPLPPTTKERYAAAVKAIRKSGVSIRQNVSACCRGCAEPFKTTKGFDKKTTPYAWNFGGQGGAIRWDKAGQSTLLSKEQAAWTHSAPTQKVYFNHGNGSAERIVAAFEEEGFEVTWDGNPLSCVEVTVPARTLSRWER